MSEPKPTKDYYTDIDELGDEYCKAINCSICFGTDINGEPNGYGCEGRDNFVDENCELICEDVDELKEKLEPKLDQAIKERDEAVAALKDAKAFHDHIFGKEKRVDWGKTFVDWSIVNKGLVAVEQALEKIEQFKNEGSK